MVDQVIKNNPNKFQEYKNGKEKLYGFFVGEVMKITKGKANPNMVNVVLTEKLAR